MVREEAMREAGSSSCFPSPVVCEIREGTSSERQLLCLLAPSHKDHITTQIRNFPQLDSLTAEDLASLKKKFIAVDEPSYNEWYHLLFASVRSIYI